MTDLIGPDAIDRERENVRLWRHARLEEEGKLCVGCGEEVEPEDASIALEFSTEYNAGVRSKLFICQSCLNIVRLIVTRKTKRDGVRDLIRGWVTDARAGLARQ